MKIHLVIVGTLATVCSQVFLSTVTYAQSAAEQSVCQQDGSYAVFAQHPLYQGAWGRGGSDGDRPNSPVGDTLNLELSHEHIFFCNNGRVTDNVGFGPGGRFSYPDEALRTGQEANGGRVDNFVPIDSEQYNSDVIRQILSGGTILPDRCNLNPPSDGSYGGLVNNCQGWTARVREEYWQTIIVGSYQWFNGATAHILPNGQLSATNGATGSWRLEGENRYVLTWYVQGQTFVDTLRLSSDSLTLSGANQYGYTVSGQRIR